MSEQKQAEMLLICGPNGAGKSTLRAITQKEINMPFVDQDQVVREKNCSYMEAGRIISNEIKRYINEKQSFGRESTLSSKFDLQLIENAKSNGFKISLLYVGVESQKKSILRVAVRHARGGHTVAEEDIRRRYTRSMENLPKAVELADSAIVLDNSKNDYKEVARFEKGIMVSNSFSPVWFKNAMELQKTQETKPIEKQSEQKSTLTKVCEKIINEQYKDKETRELALKRINEQVNKALEKNKSLPDIKIKQEQTKEKNREQNKDIER